MLKDIWKKLKEIWQYDEIVIYGRSSIRLINYAIDKATWADLIDKNT